MYRISAAISLLFFDHFVVVFGAKIILASPQAPSHISEQLNLGSELLARGHDVYLAIGSRYPNIQTIRQLGIRPFVYHIPDDVLYMSSVECADFVMRFVFQENPFDSGSRAVYGDCTFMMEDGSFLSEAKRIRFDLAIVGIMAISSCPAVLPAHLGIPFVAMTTTLLPWQLRLPALPSFYSVVGPYESADLATVWGRARNLLTFVSAELGIGFPGAGNVTLLERYAPRYQSWGELVRKSELVLVETDHHVGMPVPTLPNIISVPGMTVKASKPLEAELESAILHEGKDLVVMSFGSFGLKFPREVARKFLEAFSRLNQTVVVRLEVPEDVPVPKNVKAFPWLPQNDLLGHSRVKLFLTHCGNNGLHEALFHAVPIIGFPMFAEQRINCHSACAKGFGLRMNILDFSADDLYRNIMEAIYNPKYRLAIKKASEIFRSRPMTSQQKAVLWIEHVIKYGGSHLHSSAVDLPLYQFLMLDIVAIFLLVIFTLFISMLFAVSRVIGFLYRVW